MSRKTYCSSAQTRAHYNDVIISAMVSKWPASRLFTQPFIQAQIKENIKAPRPWPLCGESPVTGEFPAQRASNTENVSIWWCHHVMYYLLDAWEQIPVKCKSNNKSFPLKTMLFKMEFVKYPSFYTCLKVFAVKLAPYKRGYSLINITDTQSGMDSIFFANTISVLNSWTSCDGIKCPTF